jgi:hypothetical protein
MKLFVEEQFEWISLLRSVQCTEDGIEGLNKGEAGSYV